MNKWMFDKDIYGGEDAVRHLNDAARALRAGDNQKAANALEDAARELSPAGLYHSDAKLKGAPGGFYQMRLVKYGRVVTVHPSGQVDVLVGDGPYPYERVGVRLSLRGQVKEGEQVILRFFLDDPQMPFVDELLAEIPWNVP